MCADACLSADTTFGMALHGSGLPLLLLIWRPCHVTWLLFQVDQSLGRARVLGTDTGGEVHVVVADF